MWTRVSRPAPAGSAAKRNPKGGGKKKNNNAVRKGEGEHSYRRPSRGGKCKAQRGGGPGGKGKAGSAGLQHQDQDQKPRRQGDNWPDVGQTRCPAGESACYLERGPSSKVRKGRVVSHSGPGKKILRACRLFSKRGPEGGVTA